MVRRDHADKTSGRTRYLEDRWDEPCLVGHFLRSTQARARVLAVRVPPLPDGYIVVDRRDVPGENSVAIVLRDTPVFAGEIVEYVGEPILMIAGPDEAEVLRLLSLIEVDYEPLTPCLDPSASDTVFFEYAYERGDWAAAFSDAEGVWEETFKTGMQEHVHMETNAMMADCSDGMVTVSGSMQCPFYLVNALSLAMGVPREQVRVIQLPTGGAFGGKEDFPSILACQVAVAARKAGAPVRCVNSRQEDIAYSPKRHPSICRYKAAYRNGRVTALDIDVTYDGGAYSTLSCVVLQRGLICSAGCYDIPNLRVHGRAVKTNAVPCGAFRGFGGPQVFFSTEMLMAHIAARLHEEPVAFKLRHAVREGMATQTSGRFHAHVPIPEMTARVLEMSDYREKRARYDSERTGRYRRGVGFSLAYHGCGFTGTGERDLIKAVARLRGNADGTIDILISNTEMGQGLKTAFVKLVSEKMGVDAESVRYADPDTRDVSDAGPTVASRSVMIVGDLLTRCCDELRATWKPGETRVVETHFQQPSFTIPFDLSSFTGDAYPDFSWSANVIELELDTLTGVTRVLGAWGVYDVGVPVDRRLVTGQMQGGIAQAIGYAGMEKIGYNDKGVIRNDHLSDYIIPTAADVGEIAVDFVVNPYPYSALGAKGAGELPHVGGAPAYLLAMEQALGDGVPRAHIPFTFEDALEALTQDAASANP